MTRILILSWEYPPLIEGGLARHVRKLLRQRGWDVTQSTLSRDLRDPEELEAILSLLTARVAGQLLGAGCEAEQAEDAVAIEILGARKEVKVVGDRRWTSGLLRTRATSITRAVPDPSSLAASPMPCPSMCAPMMYISPRRAVPHFVQKTWGYGSGRTGPMFMARSFSNHR